MIHDFYTQFLLYSETFCEKTVCRDHVRYNPFETSGSRRYREQNNLFNNFIAIKLSCTTKICVCSQHLLNFLLFRKKNCLLEFYLICIDGSGKVRSSQSGIKLSWLFPQFFYRFCPVAFHMAKPVSIKVYKIVEKANSHYPILSYFSVSNFTQLHQQFTICQLKVF